MALATLCHDYARRNPKNTPAFTAFIVNHGLRAGSDIEAVEVARTLNRLNIEAKVLLLDWKPGSLKVNGTGTPSNLETKARELRYRALGQACYAANVPSLLIAHHAEDQAETVLLRMQSGYTGFGLRGMLPVANIPDCLDLIGERPGPSHLESQPHLISQAVKICRPLLPFHKDELIDICREAGVLWFEDHTNKDIGLTPRNTIRHMLRRNLVPTALRTDRLCQLAKSIGDQEEQCESKTEALLRKLPLEMHTAFGTLTCTIDPNAIREAAGNETEVGRIQTMLLRRVISLVSPNSKIALRDLDVPMKYVYSHGQDSHKTTQYGVSIAGVQLYVERSIDPDGSRTVHIARANPPSAVLDSSALYVRLPRSSQSRSSTGDATTSSIVSPSNAKASSPQESTAPKPLWSRWHLFDNRFWIRIGQVAPPPDVSSETPEEHTTFRIRFLRDSDFSSRSELQKVAFSSAIWDHSASWASSRGAKQRHLWSRVNRKSNSSFQATRQYNSACTTLSYLRSLKAPLRSLPVIEALQPGASSINPEHKEGESEDSSSYIVALPSLGWGCQEEPGVRLGWREWRSTDPSTSLSPTATATANRSAEDFKTGSWVFECRYRLGEELSPTEDDHATMRARDGIIARHISGQYAGLEAAPCLASSSAPSSSENSFKSREEGCLMARFLAQGNRLPEEGAPSRGPGATERSKAKP